MMVQPKYWEYYCMTEETDVEGAPLICDPDDCGIDDCPIMILRSQLNEVRELAEKWVKVQPSPYDNGTRDPPISVSIFHACGGRLKELLGSIDNQEVRKP